MGKPPIGEKRFRRPEPVDSWDGIHDATKRPNACVSILDETFGSGMVSQIRKKFLEIIVVRIEFHSVT